MKIGDVLSEMTSLEEDRMDEGGNVHVTQVNGASRRNWCLCSVFSGLGFLSKSNNCLNGVLIV